MIQGRESSTPAIRFASSAIRCCFVDTFIGLWVPLVWPNNGSVTRSLPSLLTGFPRVGVSLLSTGTIKGLKTSRVLPASSVAFAARYHAPRLSGASLPWLSEGTNHGPGTCSAGRVPPGYSRGGGDHGISQLPRESNVHLPCSQTPAGSDTPSLYSVPMLPPLFLTTKAPATLSAFRGSITRLLHSLSTLRAVIADDDARLASGGWLTLTGWGCLPTGFQR